MSERGHLVRSQAADVGKAPVSINGEDVVFHEIVALSPAKLEEKEPVNGGSRADDKSRAG